VDAKNRIRIVDAVEALRDWPNCRNVIALEDYVYGYRLRVGNYRVFFDVEGKIRVIHIEEVKKRDEHTY